MAEKRLEAEGNMGFKLFLTISNLLIPSIMLFFGMKFEKRGPRKINGIYGYRTTMSMKNQETWEFAHKYCGMLWKKAGIVLLITSVIVSLAALKLNEFLQSISSLLLVAIQMAVLIGSIFPVEKALRENFDANGNRH